MMTKREILEVRHQTMCELKAARKAYMIARTRGTLEEEQYFARRTRALRDELDMWDERLSEYERFRPYEPAMCFKRK